ncbi:fibroblast growth factor 2 isoform X1 [Canis lupus dingo]|uniref:fibroblast growth factor 2 isoform X1 n=1 Tax=Canis lupus dingo TaxID=286419 RepID=UPI0020C4B3D1|nr:fibroblast growth factor 2 isoform X1 [Canis lupus dingo]
MAAGSITTLPALPEDGGSGAFPPGHFKDPKRLYCKNGGFFLRIHPDGRVDGVREKSDPHETIVGLANLESAVQSSVTLAASRFPWRYWSASALRLVLTIDGTLPGQPLLSPLSSLPSPSPFFPITESFQGKR